MQSKKDTAE